MGVNSVGEHTRARERARTHTRCRRGIQDEIIWSMRNYWEALCNAAACKPRASLRSTVTKTVATGNIMYARIQQIAEHCAHHHDQSRNPVAADARRRDAAPRRAAPRRVGASETLLIGVALRVSELEKRAYVSAARTSYVDSFLTDGGERVDELTRERTFGSHEWLAWRITRRIRRRTQIQSDVISDRLVSRRHIDVEK